MHFATEWVQHNNADPGASAPPHRVEADDARRREYDQAREPMGRPRVSALAAVRAEAVGDHEPTPVDTDPNPEAVGDADRGVGRVVSEGLVKL